MRQFNDWLQSHPRRSRLLVLFIGVILTFVVLGGLRFVITPNSAVHYHADMAVFINGQRERFAGPQYYQEVAACDESTSPLGRVHLHDQNNHLVHVHGDVVTWGELFTNLGWSLSNSMLYDGKVTYIDGQGGYLSFVLNGKSTRSLADEVIRDQDRLLVSFGPNDASTLNTQFSQVESDAKHADVTPDPAACQGPESHSVWMRLREAFFF